MLIKDHIIKLFRDAADAMEANTSEIDQETAMKIAELLAHIPLSKEQACQFLNMSRSKFDLYVQLGKLWDIKSFVGGKMSSLNTKPITKI